MRPTEMAWRRSAKGEPGEGEGGGLGEGGDVVRLSIFLLLPRWRQFQLASDTMVAVATPWVMSSCKMCEDRPGWFEGMGQLWRAGLQKYEKIFLSAFNEEFYNASLDVALQDAVRRGSPPCELRYESPSSVRSS